MSGPSSWAWTGTVTLTLTSRPLPGVTITVQRADGSGPPHATRTGPDGRYAVGGPDPGLYRVEEADPEGYVSLSPNTAEVTVGPGTTAEANFADYPLPRLALPLVLRDG
ncbi:MAG: carboxypeptidase-like regulatory domain-containing protein [Anaerolineae bacterium]